MRDIRCDAPFKGISHLGGWCGQLVVRISDDFHGTLEYKCPRCKQIRTVRVDLPAYSVTT